VREATLTILVGIQKNKKEGIEEERESLYSRHPALSDALLPGRPLTARKKANTRNAESDKEK